MISKNLYYLIMMTSFSSIIVYLIISIEFHFLLWTGHFLSRFLLNQMLHDVFNSVNFDTELKESEDYP